MRLVEEDIAVSHEIFANNVGHGHKLVINLFLGLFRALEIDILNQELPSVVLLFSSFVEVRVQFSLDLVNARGVLFLNNIESVKVPFYGLLAALHLLSQIDYDFFLEFLCLSSGRLLSFRVGGRLLRCICCISVSVVSCSDTNCGTLALFHLIGLLFAKHTGVVSLVLELLLLTIK